MQNKTNGVNFMDIKYMSKNISGQNKKLKLLQSENNLTYIRK
uniref:Uncharacterized protein n=1 Tax=viral metagenome TaxID=1070528 RepID=A0A6C0JM39_9ZZZZ